MPLAAPNLDDRRFQDLVDDAKRLVQLHCPEWTDHNVSDPGVTLIETFAYMVDQLFYRLNRVPDRLLVTFMDLAGLRPHAPAAASTDVTFWLSGPQAQAVDVPRGTQVATLRTEAEEPIVFSTIDDRAVVPCALEALATRYEGQAPRDRTDELRGLDPSIAVFHTNPEPGDELLIGLSRAVPSCAVLLHLEFASIQGVGVDPDDPPLGWDAWNGDAWQPCEVDHDTTGGLNRAGDIVLHVPPGHSASVLAGRRAAWLRCRATEPRERQPAYSSSPRLSTAEACTIGVTVRCLHAEPVTGEVLGVADGLPGGSWPLRRTPVVEGPRPVEVEISADPGWHRWIRVGDFTASDADSRHFTLDPASGEVRMGPAIRDPDGELRHHGAVPHKGATLRVPLYYVGGGRAGNVARRTLSVLKSAIPYVERVENRRPAHGGVDGETLDEAMTRAPLHLRSRERAVTAEDYEQIAREAAPDIARVRCVPVRGEPGAVRVLLVPDDDGTLEFGELVPSADALERIRAALSAARVIGARVVVEPPHYQGVTVVARLRARRGWRPEAIEAAAASALDTYLHPLRGGPEGHGWPFGRALGLGEIFGVLERVDGVGYVEEVRLFSADPVTGHRQPTAQRIELGEGELLFGYEHQLLVSTHDDEER